MASKREHTALLSGSGDSCVLICPRWAAAPKIYISTEHQDRITAVADVTLRKAAHVVFILAATMHAADWSRNLPLREIHASCFQTKKTAF